MPLLLLLLIALSAGVLVAVVARKVPAVDIASPAKIDTAASAAVEQSAERGPLRTFLAKRADPGVATGLALSIALLVAVAGGVVLAVLAYLVRSNAELRRLDNGAAHWGNDHATALSTHGLNVVTNFGGWFVVVPLLVVVIAVETLRLRSVWIVPFLAVLMIGNEAIMLTIKDLAHRARPTFNPHAASLGPSFPSGHSATAAAFYAGVALLLARGRSPLSRSLLAGGAVAIAVAVAASRVLLDVHWLSDVIAGIVLGWAWFAVCCIAFGGRLLRFGAPAETAVEEARSGEAPREPSARAAAPSGT
jgi:undecaprenyl-diphosphatase